jgi:hypothetical protein
MEAANTQLENFAKSNFAKSRSGKKLDLAKFYFYYFVATKSDRRKVYIV